MSVEPATLAGPAVPDGVPSEDASTSDAPVIRLIRAAGLFGVLLALISTTVTFLVLTGATRVEPSPDVVRIAMIVNGALVGVLILLVAWEVGRLLSARRRRRAASRLHIRLVAVLSVLAAAPAVILAVTASATLDRGLDNWFSVRTRAIVDNSLSIARAYASQQTELLRADMRAAKAELSLAGDLLRESPTRFDTLLRAIALDQRLVGAYLVSGEGEIVREAPFSSTSMTPPPPSLLETAGSQPDGVFIIPPGPENLIGAVTRLESYENEVYLFGARPLDPQTARYLAITNDSVLEYRRLEATRSNMQIAFAILFLGITVVLLLSAIWLGIGFANRLVSPIRRLIDAANEVSHGNLEVRVVPRASDGDVGALGTTFNTMTTQLQEQRQDLVAASEQMDRRRRFTEAVLAGVTAGVVGIDADGRITIANRTAMEFLGLSAKEATGTPIAEAVPQLEPVVSAALGDERPEHRDQVSIMRAGRERTVNVRVTTERSTDHSHGYVITLDDITDLVTAQRSSAWADIARRIAHEIKNPLTPIQLSAERLRRKFGERIEDDREIFDQCTDTIVRQVGDIGRMVDEFSSFARMPKPSFQTADLTPTIREAVFLISVSKPDIAFDMQLPENPLEARFDARLLGQALANLVKNATEAIEAVPPEEDRKGEILVRAGADSHGSVIDVIDNGIGLPQENRQKLLEPYMTTREKGTGLGLAIVTKIVEEHSGRIELLDAPKRDDGVRGAMVRVTLPPVTSANEAAASHTESTTSEEPSKTETVAETMS